jgi:hypothetical protein
MANKKISALNVNTNPTMDDVFPVVNNGETKKLSLSGLTDFIAPYIEEFSVLPVIGFIVSPNSINQDVNLPEESTVRYFGPLTMGSGYNLNVPLTTTLIIL